MNHEAVYRTAPATPGLLNTNKDLRQTGERCHTQVFVVCHKTKKKYHIFESNLKLVRKISWLNILKKGKPLDRAIKKIMQFFWKKIAQLFFEGPNHGSIKL